MQKEPLSVRCRKQGNPAAALNESRSGKMTWSGGTFTRQWSIERKSISLRKHAYSNIWKISPKKN